MAVADWDMPFYLVTDLGSLTLNDAQGADGGFMLDVTQCKAGLQIRASKDNVPQSDGSILHKRFVTGYEMHFALSYWQAGVPGTPEAAPACRTSVLSVDEMNDTLMRQLRALVDGNGRILWQPPYGDTRLLDQVKLWEAPSVVVQNGLTGVEFTVDSPFPYVIDYTQLTASFSGGTTGLQTITNGGSAPFYPVWKVYGPTTTFVITNVTTGELIEWDGSLPGVDPIGVSDYAEINTFNNTIYLNGDEDDLMPGINFETSDFFPLHVGDQDLEVTAIGSGAPPDADLLYQNAWF